MEESIMVMEQSRPHLQNLSKLAPELHQATDRYMAELKAIEEELNKLNLGIAVELDDPIERSNSKNRDEDSTYHAWTLGYGKHPNQGNWCLLVREYEVNEGKDWREAFITPLLQCSRDLRLAAAERIPELLKTIEAEVKTKIEALAKVSDKPNK
jgi:hypothetical protein